MKDETLDDVECFAASTICISEYLSWRMARNISLESRFINEEGGFWQDPEQYSLRFEPEYIHSFENDFSFTFQALIREDSMDDERSHIDSRELSWLTYGDEGEFKVGVSKAFLGVAESSHLVDVINQTDSVENIDGEDKLGQSMLNMTFIRDWGVVDFFILPLFRERTFAGVDGRFRAPFLLIAKTVSIALRMKINILV